MESRLSSKVSDVLWPRVADAGWEKSQRLLKSRAVLLVQLLDDVPRDVILVVDEMEVGGVGLF